MCDAIFARCVMKRIRTARPAVCVARQQPRAAGTHCTHSIHRSLSLFALPSSPPRPRSLCEPRHFAGKLQHKQDSTRYNLKAQPTLFTAALSTYAAAGRVPRAYGCYSWSQTATSGCHVGAEHRRRCRRVPKIEGRLWAATCGANSGSRAAAEG